MSIFRRKLCQLWNMLEEKQKRKLCLGNNLWLETSYRYLEYESAYFFVTLLRASRNRAQFRVLENVTIVRNSTRSHRKYRYYYLNYFVYRLVEENFFDPLIIDDRSSDRGTNRFPITRYASYLTNQKFLGGNLRKNLAVVTKSV